MENANRIFISHMNSPKKPCVDGFLSGLIANAHVELFGEQNTHYNLYFSQPASIVDDNVLKRNEGGQKIILIPESDINSKTRIAFCDCHPEPDDVEKGALLKLKDENGNIHNVPFDMYEHHLSHLEILAKKNEQDLSLAKTESILEEVAGCHMVARKLLVDPFFKEYQNEKDFSELVKQYQELSEEDKFINALDYLSSISQILHCSDNEKFSHAKEIITTGFVDIIKFAAKIDLFSLGYPKGDLGDIKIPNQLVQGAVETILKQIPDNTKSNLSINSRTVFMNLFDQHARRMWEKNVADKLEQGESCLLPTKELVGLISELSHFQLSQQDIQQLQDKYKLLEILEKCSLEIDGQDVHEQLNGKKLFVFPFSVSSGINKDLLKSFVDSGKISQAQQTIIESGANDGLVREIEAALIKLMKPHTESKQDTLLVMLGVSASFRANFPMVTFDKPTKKVVNHLKKEHGFNRSGGHPQAAGASLADEQVTRIINKAKELSPPIKPLTSTRYPSVDDTHKTINIQS